MKNLFVSLHVVFLLCGISLSHCASINETSNEEDIFEEVLWAKIVSMPADKRLSVGIVLSGGGARGFAHTGVLDILEKNHFPIDMISGTSMGAVIGGLYASGMGVERIWKFASEADTKNVSKDFKGFSFLELLIKNKLISPKYITAFVNDNLGGKKFSELKIPFACVSMDFCTGEKIIFTRGALSLAVRASVNLPGMFEPIKYRHRYLVDGGVVDFLPVDAARHLGAKWILSSWVESNNNVLPRNVFSSLLQVIDIRGKILARKSAAHSDFIIKPDVKDIKVADFNKCYEAGNKGLIEAKKNIKKAKRKYIADSLPFVWRFF